MVSAKQPNETRRRSQRLLWFGLFAAAVAFIAVVGGTAYVSRESARENLLASSRNDLRLYIANVRRELEKYEYLPQLLAEDARLQHLLRTPSDFRTWRSVNHYLELAATDAGASDVYLLDREGRTLAASNWRQPNTFIGDNYAFRPYFRQALAGGRGRYFALGWASAERGYYFAYPVRDSGEITGVVAVKVALASLEAERGDGTEFIITDPDGVIFLSTLPGWRYHTLHDLEPVDRERIESSQRYRGRDLEALPVTARSGLESGASVLTVGNSDPRRYLRFSAAMPTAGWRVHVLAPTAGIARQAARNATLAAFVFGALVLATTIFLQRRARLAERLRYERAAMQTAEANEARVRAIIDNTRAGLLTLAADGRILSCNPTAADLLARGPAQVSGRHFAELLADGEGQRFNALLESSPQSGGEASLMELTGTRSDGSRFPMEVGFNRMSLPDGTRSIVTLHDLTERKRSELALQRAHDQLEQRVAERTRELMRSNRQLTREIEERRRAEVELRATRDELVQAAKLAAIGQLSAGINHELNQPLTAIRTYSGNARALLEKQRYDEVGQNLAEIYGLTERMRRIITQLKLFARKSSGKPVPVSIQAVVDGALQLLSPRFDRQPVQVVCNLPTEDVLCMGDIVRLEQVFVNLLSNALHAVSDNAQARIEVSARRQDRFVHVDVRDNGPGIPHDTMEQIFDAFYTTKEAGQGLGLGLSISSRIIEELGGTMHARNHPDGGAVFTVELPAAEEFADG
jgi:two-component system C4-dicarboxylate transport sensor histidine kinase DctB